jgi:hypothetical protein
MMRILVLISFILLLNVLALAQGPGTGNPLAAQSTTRETPADAKRAQTPREYIESRLGGKIVKVERDPEALLRAILFIKRSDSVTQHVLKAELNSETDLREVRIVTPNGKRSGFPPVMVMPRALISPCWFHCKEKCGQSTDCRVRCLFDCIVD